MHAQERSHPLVFKLPLEELNLLQLHKNALETSRVLKPEIPIVGNYGIPLRDELELEMAL